MEIYQARKTDGVQGEGHRPAISKLKGLFARMSCNSGRDEGAHRLRDDTTIEEMDGAVGEARVARVVGDEADGRAVLMKIGKQLHYGFTVLRIEISGWLIGRNN